MMNQNNLTTSQTTSLFQKPTEEYGIKSCQKEWKSGEEGKKVAEVTYRENKRHTTPSNLSGGKIRCCYHQIWDNLLTMLNISWHLPTAMTR